MDDDKGRDLLQRYRPVGPRPALRAIALRRPRERIWPWAAAAAVLLTATVAIHYATDTALSRIAPPAVDLTSALAEAMGGDEDARRAARLIVTEQLLLNASRRHDVNAELEELINASR